MANCTLESSPGRGSAQFNGQRKIYVASAREARSVAGLKRGKPITIISVRGFVDIKAHAWAAVLNRYRR